MLLYAIVLALVTLRPWAVDGLVLALALVAAGLTAIAVGVLITAGGGDPAGMFIDRRLSDPTGYANATANLWLIGVWPAVALACASRAPWPLRAASVGAATLLLEISLLSVSRGAVAAAAATAVVFVALCRDRLVVLGALAVVVGCTLAAAGPLLAVSDAATVAQLADALDRALSTIAWTCALATALAAAGLLRARRVPTGRRDRARPARRPRVMRAATLLAVVATAAVVVATPHPGAWVDARWQDFKSSGYSEVGTGSQRITGSLGSGRYDYYRVALNEFADHPIAGIGYGNFQVPYLVHRRTDEAPRYTHSLAFGVISQVGLIGTALLLAFLACVGAAVPRTLAARGQRTLVAGAMAGFAVWFIHGLVDWLWEFAGLGILAFALLGMAARGDVSAAERPCRPRDRRMRLAAGALAALALAVSFATLGLAARHVGDALEEAPRAPARAAARLERAARLDPLTAGPLLTRGVLARRAGDREDAARAFSRALAREPRNWFGQFELGMLHADAGRRDAALRALARAELLNPRQRLIDEVRARVQRGDPAQTDEVERALSEQLRALSPSLRAR